MIDALRTFFQPHLPVKTEKTSNDTSRAITQEIAKALLILCSKEGKLDSNEGQLAAKVHALWQQEDPFDPNRFIDRTSISVQNTQEPPFFLDFPEEYNFLEEGFLEEEVAIEEPEIEEKFDLLERTAKQIEKKVLHLLYSNALVKEKYALLFLKDFLQKPEDLTSFCQELKKIGPTLKKEGWIQIANEIAAQIRPESHIPNLLRVILPFLAKKISQTSQDNLICEFEPNLTLIIPKLQSMNLQDLSILSSLIKRIPLKPSHLTLFHLFLPFIPHPKAKTVCLLTRQILTQHQDQLERTPFLCDLLHQIITESLENELDSNYWKDLYSFLFHFETSSEVLEPLLNLLSNLPPSAKRSNQEFPYHLSVFCLSCAKKPTTPRLDSLVKFLEFDVTPQKIKQFQNEFIENHPIFKEIFLNLLNMGKIKEAIHFLYYQESLTDFLSIQPNCQKALCLANIKQDSTPYLNFLKWILEKDESKKTSSLVPYYEETLDKSLLIALIAYVDFYDDSEIASFLETNQIFQREPAVLNQFLEHSYILRNQMISALSYRISTFMKEKEKRLDFLIPLLHHFLTLSKDASTTSQHLINLLKSDPSPLLFSKILESFPSLIDLILEKAKGLAFEYDLILFLSKTPLKVKVKQRCFVRLMDCFKPFISQKESSEFKDLILAFADAETNQKKFKLAQNCVETYPTPPSEELFALIVPQITNLQSFFQKSPEFLSSSGKWAQLLSSSQLLDSTRAEAIATSLPDFRNKQLIELLLPLLNSLEAKNKCLQIILEGINSSQIAEQKLSFVLLALKPSLKPLLFTDPNQKELARTCFSSFIKVLPKIERQEHLKELFLYASEYFNTLANPEEKDLLIKKCCTWNSKHNTLIQECLNSLTFSEEISLEIKDLSHQEIEQGFDRLKETPFIGKYAILASQTLQSYPVNLLEKLFTILALEKKILFIQKIVAHANRLHVQEDEGFLSSVMKNPLRRFLEQDESLYEAFCKVSNLYLSSPRLEKKLQIVSELINITKMNHFTFDNLTAKNLKLYLSAHAVYEELSSSFSEEKERAFFEVRQTVLDCPNTTLKTASPPNLSLKTRIFLVKLLEIKLSSHFSQELLELLKLQLHLIEKNPIPAALYNKFIPTLIALKEHMIRLREHRSETLSDCSKLLYKIAFKQKKKETDEIPFELIKKVHHFRIKKEEVTLKTLFKSSLIETNQDLISIINFLKDIKNKQPTTDLNTFVIEHKLTLENRIFNQTIEDSKTISMDILFNSCLMALLRNEHGAFFNSLLPPEDLSDEDCDYSDEEEGSCSGSDELD